MAIVIKEMHIRTVVERRILTEADVSEEILLKIENRIAERLSVFASGQPSLGRKNRRKNER